MNSKVLKFAVLGAGNSGYAFSADLTLKGFSVNLYELPRFKGNLEPISTKGGIEISGEASEGFAKLNMVTTDIKEAIKNTEVIIVAAPAFAQEPLSKLCAPYLEDGQIIVFISNFGAIRSKRIFENQGVKAEIIPAETQSLIYATRITDPGHVKVFAIKSHLPIAALPTERTEEVVKRLTPAFPELVPGESVLETSLNNPNPIVHPPMTLLNTGRIESTSGKGWNLYGDGATTSVAQVMEKMDEERLLIIDELGLQKKRIKQIMTTFYRNYGLQGEKLSKLLRTSEIHAHTGAPSTIEHRYIKEDVPYGLMPLFSMANMWGISTPTINSIIQLGSIIEGVDYFKKGVNVQMLGFDGLSPDQIQEMVH